MKKILVTLLFLIFQIVSEAAVTAPLLIKASVPRRVSINVVSENISSALDLTTTQKNLKVAVVNEKSNSKTGYKVTVTSANLGKLKRSDGAEVFTYTLKLDGSKIALSSASGTTFTRNQTTPINTGRIMTISYAGKSVETMIEGSYSDTVTLNIAAR